MARKYFVRDKRINAASNAVFDAFYICDGSGREHHVAIIEIRGDAPQGIKVLLGALLPAGKERVWDAIRAYEGVA